MSLFILTGFILTYLFFNYKSKESIYIQLIYSFIAISFFVFFTSEVLSIFHLFDYNGILISWLFYNLTISFYIIKNREKIKLDKLIELIKNKKNKIILLIFSGFITLLLIQCIVYPPNNWDSLTYHMGRIPHWILNKSITPFPTHIYRQIYSPPFAELFISHVNILSKSDIFSNLVQLFFFIGSLCSVIAIFDALGLNRKSKIIGFIITLTTPEFLLQSSSTQNDLVVSFYVLCSFLFIIRGLKSDKIINYLLLGISIGLSFYTKGTAYIFLLLPVFIFGVFIVYKNLTFKTILKLSIIPIIILLVNFGFYFRNYQLSGDPLGKNEDNLFAKNITIKSSFLTISKNIGNHLSLPYLNNITNQLIEKEHLILNEKINDPDHNFNGLRFKLESWQHHEDTVSNFIVLILFITLSIISLIKKIRFSALEKTLFLICISNFLLFSVLLKWQPWHTRLLAPNFFLMIIWIGILFSKFSFSKLIITSFSFVLILYGLLIIALNPTRPFYTCNLTTKIKLTDTRDEKYCANYLGLEKDYYEANKIIKQYKNKVGLEIGSDMWDYLFYKAIYINTNQNNYPKVININNLTKSINPNNKSKKIDFIISNKNQNSIIYNHSDFIKIKSLKSLYIYKK
jgi:4-amino-4-deoxy-L-arabinose transferase-like glycosyltransferase